MIDYAERNGLPPEIIGNLQALEEDDDEATYDSIDEVWQDAPRPSDFFFSDEDDD